MTHRFLMVLVFGVALAAVPPLADSQLGPTTTRVSIATGGGQGNEWSGMPSLSADGRYVAFWATASNLVDGDTNGRYDVFVHDRQTGETARVSVATGGGQGNDKSLYSSISAEGRHVAFYSLASNLVEGDTNVTTDVFVHDRLTNETNRVSISTEGEEGNGYSYNASISGDGRHVAFTSDATNLVPGDTNGYLDVFVHDLQTRQTTRVSVATGGTQGNDRSYWPWISADGRYVAFESKASNLVQGDTNNSNDVFVHDRLTGETTRVSVATGGDQGNDWSQMPSISADGRHVAFHSLARNLVPGDTNGVHDVFVHDLQTGQTSRASIATGGGQGSRASEYPSISGDGRYVTFHSLSSTLVPGDTNSHRDVFVHDLRTGQTIRASLATGGGQGNEGSEFPSISADGRFVAFESYATNLVQGDTNGWADVFVRDRAVRSTPTGFIADP